ncbi:hypothetical protein ACHAWF_009926, partial [Thalassiosira exigua]
HLPTRYLEIHHSVVVARGGRRPIRSDKARAAIAYHAGAMPAEASSPPPGGGGTAAPSTPRPPPSSASAASPPATTSASRTRSIVGRTKRLSLKGHMPTPPRLRKGSSSPAVSSSGGKGGGARKTPIKGATPPKMPQAQERTRSRPEESRNGGGGERREGGGGEGGGDDDAATGGGVGGVAGLPPPGGAPAPHSGNTLEEYVLPPSLRLDGGPAGGGGGADACAGMEVIKVSKNGKQQPRRLGIAPGNRAVRISPGAPSGTSSFPRGPKRGAGRVLGHMWSPRNAGNATDRDDATAAGGGAGTTREVDLSRVVRVQLGQQSRRFAKARSRASDAGATPQSLSIIYRRPAASARDKLVKSMKKPGGMGTVGWHYGSSSSAVMDAGEDTLDLIVPSKSDFDALTRTLDDLLAFFREEEPCANPDHAWIQCHLVDMGKSLGLAGEDGILVSCSDWVALCRRWNAPVSKGEATAMYRAFCESLALSDAGAAGGLEMFEVVRLLEVLRQRGLEVAAAGAGGGGSGASVVSGGGRSAAPSVARETLADPRRRLFQEVAQSRSGDRMAVSAEEFLNFVHREQKEMETRLSDVNDLFYQLNGHRVSPQLEDAISVISGHRAAAAHSEAVSWEREYITWEAFGRYLLLESNDIFDPERASPSQSYMNEPINNYWINTSHDTYLRRTKASKSDHKQSGKTDLQSYTLALYRGARAIELDVWDGPNGNNDPLVRFGITSFAEGTVNKSSSSNSLAFRDVILTIGYFLQSEPQSFPVILLIENHCSLPFQEKMASDIEDVLGKQNLLYRPNPQAKETDPLHSPAELTGKVLIKSKLPTKILGTSLALNDDFDDENRESTPPSFTDYDSEDDIKENVIGFNSTGSIKSTSPQKLTAEQLFQKARAESIEATSAANAASNQLNDVVHQAQQLQNHASALLRDIGMSYEELIKKRESGPIAYNEEGTEVELTMYGTGKVKETADQAMEVATTFAESVEESRLLAIAATTEARSECELFEIAREDLTDKDAALAEAREELQEVSKVNRDLTEAAERALSEARSNREYAENAARRVEAVRGLVNRSHNQAVSSETVAGTADAEAKISEQRASEAEARYEKARSNAEKERKYAENETKLEDELEVKLISARKELNEVRAAVNAARARADDAVVKADRLTDEIREAKSMGLDDDGSIAESSVVADKKSKERRVYMGKMEKALTDKLGLESSTRKLGNMIDDLQRKAQLQAKTAATARRQADHSMSIADQLEEHALEEREAANLRQAARVKAKRGVESSDAVLTSTEAQLAEAEKAASEANDIALVSRQKAEQLSKEAEAVQDTAPLEKAVQLAQDSRDAAHSIYECAREAKEEALERAARAKQVHETNSVNLANLERDAMAELLHKESVEQAKTLAVTACENAKALRDQVESLTTKRDEAKALAVEKSAALGIATRYKEKKKRLQPLSPSLADITLLHSANFRNWDKSSYLPNHAMHSIPDAKIMKKAEAGKDEWNRWVEFNKTHISRTYPESASRNYNPLIPWAMGCQFVSMNFIRNKFMLLNDGRFRENGGRGYVLKPGYLRNDTKDADSGKGADCATSRQLSIRILSGFCLPKSAEKKSSASINPFVRVTLYDASPTSLVPSPAFKTSVVEGNGLNPVWSTPETVTFSCSNPTVGMLLFAVYDHCDVTKTDLFIGASAMPVSCVREGYRCVSLFDSNNTRSGTMKYASLFVEVKIEK